MKKTLAAILLSLVFCSCGRGGVRAEKMTKTPVVSECKQYTFRVINTYPHLTTSYTQGLQIVDGVMWEGTGQSGQSVVQRIDLATGRADIFARIPKSQFGEGVTLLGDKLYQLTWVSNTAYVYDVKTAKKIKEFRYAGEGWGLTTDGEKLYMSNGTEYIYKLAPETFKREKSIVVTFNGVPLKYLNELEWVDGKIWANIYTTDRIAIINPETGVVEGIVDLTGLLPESELTPQTDVLNGIAYDVQNKRIFVTGKNWSKLFEIEIVEK